MDTTSNSTKQAQPTAPGGSSSADARGSAIRQKLSADETKLARVKATDRDEGTNFSLATAYAKTAFGYYINRGELQDWLENALRLSHEAIEVSDQLKTHPDRHILRAEFQHSIAYIHSNIGQYREAVPYARAAVELSKNLSTFLQSNYLHNLGKILYDTQQFPEAISTLQACVEMRRPNHIELSISLRYLGSAYIASRENWTEAMAIFQELLQAEHVSGNPELLHEAHHNLSVIHKAYAGIVTAKKTRNKHLRACIKHADIAIQCVTFDNPQAVLNSDNPLLVRAIRQYLYNHSNKGDSQMILSEFKKAVASYEAIMELYQLPMPEDLAAYFLRVNSKLYDARTELKCEEKPLLAFLSAFLSTANPEQVLLLLEGLAKYSYHGPDELKTALTSLSEKGHINLQIKQLIYENPEFSWTITYEQLCVFIMQHALLQLNADQSRQLIKLVHIKESHNEILPFLDSTTPLPLLSSMENFPQNIYVNAIKNCLYVLEPSVAPKSNGTSQKKSKKKAGNKVSTQINLSSDSPETARTAPQQRTSLLEPGPIETTTNDDGGEWMTVGKKGKGKAKATLSASTTSNITRALNGASHTHPIKEDRVPTEATSTQTSSVKTPTTLTPEALSKRGLNPDAEPFNAAQVHAWMNKRYQEAIDDPNTMVYSAKAGGPVPLHSK